MSTVAQVVAEVRKDNAVHTKLPVTIERAGEGQMDLTIELGESDLGLPTMGVTWVQRYDYSAYLDDVGFDLDEAIGGDSGGLALALALYDRLTPGDLSGGETVAAAGVIELADVAGGAGATPEVAQVAAVEAIRQHIVTAAENGATVFVLPRANCTDVAGFDTTVNLVPVSGFGEAVSILGQLAAESGSAATPTC
jgi:PDZ domain-containing protein